jgi:hypothetical protein
MENDCFPRTLKFEMEDFQYMVWPYNYNRYLTPYKILSCIVFLIDY